VERIEKEIRTVKKFTKVIFHVFGENPLSNRYAPKFACGIMSQT